MRHTKERALSLALATLLGAALVSAAAAQPPEGQPSPVNPAEAFIQQHDTDGDGKVSQAEALAPQEARFKELDTDGDGFITADEFRRAFEAEVPPEVREKMNERGMPDPGETFIKELDKSGDGKVDQAEALQPSVEGFGQVDADGDGFATRDEIDAFFRKMREEASRLHQQKQGQPQAK
jgi:hypothetical protein